MPSVKYHGIFKSQTPKIFLLRDAFVGGSRIERLVELNYINRYYHQRRSIFSRYDDGIWMTEDAWYGVTPEPVAKYDLPFSAIPLKNFFFPIFISPFPPFANTGNLEKSQRN